MAFRIVLILEWVSENAILINPTSLQTTAKAIGFARNSGNAPLAFADLDDLLKFNRLSKWHRGNCCRDLDGFYGGL